MLRFLLPPLNNKSIPGILTTSLLCASPLSHTLVQTIARGVFEVIVDQSPFVPEEIGEEQKTQVGGSDLSEVKISENEMTWRKTVSKKKTGKKRSLIAIFFPR